MTISDTSASVGPGRSWFTLREFSGGLGDLGTLIPLSVAVSVVTGRDIGPILLFVGLANMATGFLFRLPVAIQPMKAIAAVAIAGGLTANEMSAAGLAVGLVVLLIALFGWTEALERFIPKPVVRGIQLGIGFTLGLKGIGFVAARPLTAIDGVLVAVALAVIVFLLRKNRAIPVALFLLLCGIATVVMKAGGIGQVAVDITRPAFMLTSVESWTSALTEGAVAQLPLTLLNSVIAVCALSGDLFPGRAISYRKMAMSVGIMNVISCPFGAMPMCHGSGGLAANYRFGARTGGAVIMLGTVLLGTGFFLGTSAMTLLKLFPLSILGVMLAFSGAELMRPALDQKTAPDRIVMIATAAGIVVINTLAGCVAGILASTIIRLWSSRNSAGVE